MCLGILVVFVGFLQGIVGDDGVRWGLCFLTAELKLSPPTSPNTGLWGSYQPSAAAVSLQSHGVLLSHEGLCKLPAPKCWCGAEHPHGLLKYLWKQRQGHWKCWR